MSKIVENFACGNHHTNHDDILDRFLVLHDLFHNLVRNGGRADDEDGDRHDDIENNG
ncbi:hypothetical protein D3C84_1137630 [compost metagenome]